MTPVWRAVVHASEMAGLRDALATVQAWSPGSHVWGHYAESTPAGPVICRTENVSACQPAVAALVDGPLHDVAAAAMGGPVVAFKDKVNYKQPGGAGFSPHQDLPAYPGVRRVVSVLLAVDACSKESGCLWLAEPSDDVLPMDERGVIAGRVARDLDWSPAELAAGDAVCIDGLAPHYSGPNRGMTPRRVLVVSYAPAAEGYDRSTYYAERRAAMAAAFEGDGRSRISVLADFDGEQVTPDEIAMDRCTHP